MQFGKQIQAEQVPGWSSYYLDYKALKKIISSLAANRPPAEAPALAPQRSVRPGNILASPTLPQTPRQATPHAQDPEEPPLYASLSRDDDRGPSFQANKAAFFFKLERELEKVSPYEQPRMTRDQPFPRVPMCLLHRSTRSTWRKKPNSSYASRRSYLNGVPLRCGLCQTRLTTLQRTTSNGVR